MQEKIGFASGHRDATQTNRTSILPTPNSLSCFYCCVHFFLLIAYWTSFCALPGKHVFPHWGIIVPRAGRKFPLIVDKTRILQLCKTLFPPLLLTSTSLAKNNFAEDAWQIRKYVVSLHKTLLRKH